MTNRTINQKQAEKERIKILERTDYQEQLILTWKKWHQPDIKNNNNNNSDSRLWSTDCSTCRASKRPKRYCQHFDIANPDAKVRG
jgi:hypothetical protein